MRMVFLTLALLLALNARSETITGGAFLASGSRKFPCSKLVRFYRGAHEPLFFSTIWGSFGRDQRCWKRVLKLPQRVTLEFYLSNEACRRNQTCERGDLLPALNIYLYNQYLEHLEPNTVERIKNRASKILAFCEQNKKPEDRCLLALGLESNFTERAAKTLERLVIEAGWKKKQLVYNPCWGHLGADIGHYYESHWLYSTPPVEASRSIVTMDGIDVAGVCSGRGLGLHRISPEFLRVWLRRESVAMFGAWCAGWQGQPAGGSRSLRKFSLLRSELKAFRNLEQ